MPLMTEMSMEVRGRDLSSGLPRNVNITSTQIEEAIKLDLRPPIFDLEFAQALSDAAVKMGKTAKAHLKVDTGMGRVSVTPSELIAFCGQVFYNLHIQLDLSRRNKVCYHILLPPQFLPIAKHDRYCPSHRCDMSRHTIYKAKPVNIQFLYL